MGQREARHAMCPNSGGISDATNRAQIVNVPAFQIDTTYKRMEGFFKQQSPSDLIALECMFPEMQEFVDM